MATVILAGMYDAVVRTEIMPRVSLPFTDSMTLAPLIENGLKRMIVEDPNAPFYSNIQTAATPHYLAMGKALAVNPVNVVGSQVVSISICS